MIRLQAPSRLHFGLLALPGLDVSNGLPVRQFGGIGLMVNRPGIQVRVERSSEWHSAGLHAERALEFARRFASAASLQGTWSIEVEYAPSEHTGLGVGTQLSLAVAKAIQLDAGMPEILAAALATMVGRGERSAIGIHGFERGGLIVEGGKLPSESVSPLIGRWTFPEEWAVVLVSPPVMSDWHGDRERNAIGGLQPSPSETDRLCRLILMSMLPALASKNLDEFGEALFEFNARVGDQFASVQGGRYSSPAVAECVKRLRDLGVKGVGQSSWGPTVFAVVPNADAARIAENADAPAVIAEASQGFRFERTD